MGDWTRNFPARGHLDDPYVGWHLSVFPWRAKRLVQPVSSEGDPSYRQGIAVRLPGRRVFMAVRVRVNHNTAPAVPK